MTINVRNKPGAKLALRKPKRSTGAHNSSSSRSVAHAVEVGERAGLTREQLSQRLNLSLKTFDRRLKQGTLEPGEAIFIEMIERIQTEAAQYFENPDDIRAWLNTPLVGLGNQSPLEMLTTIKGYDRVREALIAQAYGMFA